MPLVTIAGPSSRLYNFEPPGASGEWADVYFNTVAGMPAALATPGNKVGVRATNLGNLSQQLTSGNGATMSIITNGAYDGVENAMKITPPTVALGSPDPNGQYACIFRGLDLWNGGATNIAQINFRWLSYFGPRYYDLGAPCKFHGFLAASSLGGAPGPRQGVWEDRNTAWTTYKYLSTTSNSVQSYHYPPNGTHIDDDSDTNKLCQIAGSANHALNPPRIGNEWVCFETSIDLRQNRGNANGAHKLYLWTRDGVVNGRFLNTPVNWDSGGWSFSNQYMASMEGFGFYWNPASTANVDNYTLSSHWTFATNMGINSLIGPPPGFLL
jgi:hypothetical protein